MIPSIPSAATILFTFIPPSWPMALADHHEPTALGAFVRLHREHVDPAHDVLPVSRDQIPPRLSVVGVVLLPVVARSDDAIASGDRRADGLVHGVLGAQLRDEIARYRVDLDRPAPRRQAHEVDMGAGR